MKMRIASLSLLTVCCLMLAVAPAMADTLYSNGAYNGTNDAWTINFGFAVSDSYSLSGCPAQGCSVESLHIVYWDASSTDLLTTVDMQLGGTSFSGTTHTLTGATNQFISTNQYGYFLYSAWFTFGNLGSPNGTSYVTLSNACSTSGCSVSNPIYWDENSGPSTAYENTIGSIPSEAFTLDGTRPGTTPEPSSILLFGSGILGLAGVLRRKLNR
jgi:PEP-CTERM motif